ncbi:LOW QUALITY PROTEIN: alpha-N-acetylgalactosaminidase-like [Liolophura sinensis]|uniref:LOW QUALITY PROTEIN: alpha-N-acetylgalactosaminidase-like n=1 Tax=Liolophura sinensis TaxID=3198878 RepID=UPI00315987FF
MRVVVCCMLLGALFSALEGLDNGLALTPPMGWLAWERFRCDIDCADDPKNCIGQSLFMEMADRMVADGYRDAGYTYVNIDDCWASKQRDANFRLQADPKRFPDGIKNLAKYVHSKGLKLGIYGDFGILTCGGYPGSKFFLQTDAQTFAEWEVDMLKLDGCYSDLSDMDVGYPLMSEFLNKTGRPILYSCSWPAYIVGSGIPNYPKIAKYCNIWRNYADVQDSWDSVINIIEYYGNDTGNFSAVAGPGNFNDPDMLILGDFGLSYQQQRAQMALWAIMASPLFMSTDLRKIDPQSKNLLLNTNVIAINQDPLGIQGKRLVTEGAIEVWARPILPHGSVAFAVLSKSTGGTPTTMGLTLKSLGLSHKQGYNVTEAFDGFAVGMFRPKDTITIQVDPTGVFLAVAKPHH